MQKIVTNLLFDGNAEQAVAHYIAALGDGRVTGTLDYGPNQPGPEGEVMLVEFELMGQKFVAINGGPEFPFTEAISLEVRCRDQAEIDRVWEALVEGGTELPCGWLKDKYGLAWQISPENFHEYTQGDPEAVARFMERMLATHGKFDLAELQAAYDGTA